MINVLGDALAAGIMAHICRKDFAQDTDNEVRAVPPPCLATQRPWQVEPGWDGHQSSTHQLGSHQPIPPASLPQFLIWYGGTNSSHS